MCSENTPVNRFELGQEQRIAKLETEVALRDANIFTDGKLNELRNYVDIKIANTGAETSRQFDKVDYRLGHIDGRLNQVDVYAATNNATIGCMQQQIDVLNGITKTVIPNDSVCPGWGAVEVTPDS